LTTEGNGNELNTPGGGKGEKMGEESKTLTIEDVIGFAGEDARPFEHESRWPRIGLSEEDFWRLYEKLGRRIVKFEHDHGVSLVRYPQFRAGEMAIEPIGNKGARYYTAGDAKPWVKNSN
jgi:hypothetical protein